MEEVNRRMQQFEKDFGKLKANRAKVPLELLRTQYAKSYNALTGGIGEFVEWFMDLFFTGPSMPLHPKDEAGNKWRADREAGIRQEEKQPGGLYDQARAALIDNLDRQLYEAKVMELYNRLRREVWDPYQQRYNRWVGKPGNRWIYNSLWGAFWLPRPECKDGGWWIDREHNHVRSGYPPNIGPDPEGDKQQKSEVSNND